jgi:thiamine-monophosphate kinase
VTLREIGEFALIDRLRALLGPQADERLVAGIGDDAAAWRTADDLAIATTDTMVAGVHFLPNDVPWADVGWKALAVNVSDVAAMGGAPAFALVTLALPPDLPVDAVDGLYAGLRACASAYGVTVAGGDIVAAPVFCITIALYGTASRRRGEPALLRRGTARPGDIVAATGALGGSAGGLRALTGGIPRTGAAQQLIERHARPRPRLDAGHAAVAAGITCAIDISDGLVQDLGHVCRASGVDAEVRLADIPLDAALVQVFGDDAPLLAATGGEDYELLLVGPEDALRRVGEALAAPLVAVGRVTGAGAGNVRLVGPDGRDVRLDAGGWDHLRGRPA